MEPAPVIDPTAAAPLVDAPPSEARCPVPHVVASLAPGCPIDHTARTADGPAPERSRADEVVRKVLRIRERPEGVTDAAAYRSFQRSMLISAIRCTLTYVVFPFVLPAVGFATGVGPLVGLLIGSVAITCDVFAIRRFFAVDHKYRWHFSAIAACIIGLLLVLLVQDLIHLLT